MTVGREVRMRNAGCCRGGMGWERGEDGKGRERILGVPWVTETCVLSYCGTAKRRRCRVLLNTPEAVASREGWLGGTHLIPSLLATLN